MTPPMPQSAAPRRTLLLAGLAMAAAMLAWSPVANAQINPFRGYKGPVLSKADIDQGTQAADKLLNADEAKVGASEAWTGFTSGNSGTITVLRAFDRQSMPCRALRSVINYKTGVKRTWNLNVCKVSSGEWKIA